MASSHHPHAALHHNKTKRSAVRAARSAPVPQISLNKGIKIKHTKKEEDFSIDTSRDDDMTPSFLQYCAMCEKQIVIPDTSVLYCSESCRRKDAYIHDSNPSLSLGSPHPMSPTFELDKGFKARAILPRALPTPRSLDARIPPVAHDGKSDLDPTEWKPSDGGSAEGSPRGSPGDRASIWKPKLVHGPSSEAYTYLSRFHRSAPSSLRRPGTPSRSTPSLSYEPTMSSSEDESVASTPSGTSMARLGATVKHSDSVKGIDLVTPTYIAFKDANENALLDSSLHGDFPYKKQSTSEGKKAVTVHLMGLLCPGGMDDKNIATM